MFKNEFQGGNFVEVFVAKDPPQKYKLLNVEKQFNKEIKGYIYNVVGPTTSSNISFPLKTSKFTSLWLTQRFINIQLFLPSSSDFAIEFVVCDVINNKRRIILSTSIKDQIFQTPLHVKYSLNSVMRNDIWINFSFDLLSLSAPLINIQSYRCLHHLTLSGTFGLRRIFTSKSYPPTEGIPSTFLMMTSQLVSSENISSCFKHSSDVTSGYSSSDDVTTTRSLKSKQIAFGTRVPEIPRHRRTRHHSVVTSSSTLKVDDVSSSIRANSTNTMTSSKYRQIARSVDQSPTTTSLFTFSSKPLPVLPPQHQPTSSKLRVDDVINDFLPGSDEDISLNHDDVICKVPLLLSSISPEATKHHTMTSSPRNFQVGRDSLEEEMLKKMTSRFDEDAAENTKITREHTDFQDDVISVDTSWSTCRNPPPLAPQDYESEMNRNHPRQDLHNTLNDITTLMTSSSNPRGWDDVIMNSPPLLLSPECARNMTSKERPISDDSVSLTDDVIADGDDDVTDEMMLELMYDPCLNCYFDPKTGKYYELKH